MENHGSQEWMVGLLFGYGTRWEVLDQLEPKSGVTGRMAEYVAQRCGLDWHTVSPIDEMWLARSCMLKSKTNK